MKKIRSLALFIHNDIVINLLIGFFYSSVIGLVIFKITNLKGSKNEILQYIYSLKRMEIYLRKSKSSD